LVRQVFLVFFLFSYQCKKIYGTVLEYYAFLDASYLVKYVLIEMSTDIFVTVHYLFE